MSRAKVISLVARKEFLDMARDRRTILTALVVPLVSFPILFGVMGYVTNPTSNPSPILVNNLDGGNYSTALTSRLLNTSGLSLTVSNNANLTGAVRTGKYDIGLQIPPGFSASVQGGGQANLTVYYDPTNGRALQGVTIIQGVITALSQQVSSSRLSGKGVTNADLYPIGMDAEQVGNAQNASLVYTANLFPSFLLYFTFLGAFYFMVDDIAGEKERRSLEALFTLAPSRTTIFLGKYTVAFLLSMITTMLGLVGTLIGLEELSQGSSAFSLPLIFYPEVLGIVALAALSLSALGFCISTFAKNVKEAQQYLSPLFLIFFLPLYFVFILPPSQLSQYAVIPVIGYTLLIRDMVLGTMTAGELVLSIAVNLAVLFFLIWLGLRLLASEKVVLRSG